MKPKKPRHKFTPPTLQEVIHYADSLNVQSPVDLATKFIDCYAPEWRDTRDQPIRNWKMKFRRIWAKNNHKKTPTKTTEDWTL